MALHIPKSNPSRLDLNPNSLMLLLKVFLSLYESLFPPIGYIIPLYKHAIRCFVSKLNKNFPWSSIPLSSRQMLSSNSVPDSMRNLFASCALDIQSNQVCSFTTCQRPTVRAWIIRPKSQLGLKHWKSFRTYPQIVEASDGLNCPFLSSVVYKASWWLQG